MFNKAENIKKYLRKEMLPTIFCTGCGVGNTLNYTLRAIDELRLDIDNVVFISGIGCSSRLPGYVDADGLHTTHGRAIAFATGVKAAKPDLDVIVFTGDGDCAGIGGNHLIHAARRNIDITVIEMNNFNYGMTGGQVSPTTPLNGTTTTSPFGNLEQPFDLPALMVGAGAPFVARWPMGYPYETIDTIKQGIEKKGFSFIEIFTPCPTGYTVEDGAKKSRQVWDWYKENTILASKYRALTDEERAEDDRALIGILQDVEKREFTAEWKKLVEKLAPGAGA
jgi:2-oxoglutarate ferredoxin oxidoreductase subunit beta